MTPIGINLPNDQSVREEFGSKSVSLSNVVDAYDRSSPGAYRREFSWDEAEAVRSEKWGSLAGELNTNMHEVIGHASGQLEDRLEGNPQAFIKEQYSALEESRADLVALYFIADPKLVELGLVPAEDHDEIVRAQYEAYTRNAILQLRRVREGSQIEEDHMRNRQMIVHWLMDNTEAIEVRERDGKTFYVMTDARGLPRGNRGLARRGPADQVPGGLRRREDAVRELRDSLRPGAARPGSREGGDGRPPLLLRIRDAETRGRVGGRWRDRRRDDLVSSRLHAADAGVFREEGDEAGFGLRASGPPASANTPVGREHSDKQA